VNSRTIKNSAAIVFFALVCNAFSVAIFAEKTENSAAFVYCPLTKKLQPVKAAQKETKKNPLTEICADEKYKKSFADEIFGANLAKTNSLDEKQFENLAFDFFQKGKASFKGLPAFPDAPRKNSAKSAAAFFISGRNETVKFAASLKNENFSYAQNPRPPNRFSADSSEPQTFPELEKISRRIAPRAPPFSV